MRTKPLQENGGLAGENFLERVRDDEDGGWKSSHCLKLASPPLPLLSCLFTTNSRREKISGILFKTFFFSLQSRAFLKIFYLGEKNYDNIAKIEFAMVFMLRCLVEVECV